MQQFKIQICNPELRYVWCCRNGEQATNAELEALNKKQTAVQDEIIKGEGSIRKEIHKLKVLYTHH